MHGMCKTKGFPNPQSVKRLEMIHTREKPYEQKTCKECCDKVDNERELKEHVSSVHGGKKVYRCPICKACFAEASKLKRHIEPQRL